jgi:hypothetical protein
VTVGAQLVPRPDPVAQRAVLGPQLGRQEAVIAHLNRAASTRGPTRPCATWCLYYEWDGEREPVTLQRVRSLIVEPAPDDDPRPGELAIRGVAWSGAAPIGRVEVSVGGGLWQPAQLVGERSRHAWQWWELIARVEAVGPTTIRARATDLAGRSQPEQPPWNRLGYGNNAIEELRVGVARFVSS